MQMWLVRGMAADCIGDAGIAAGAEGIPVFAAILRPGHTTDKLTGLVSDHQITHLSEEVAPIV